MGFKMRNKGIMGKVYVRCGTESYLYAIRLQNGFIYVGLTINVDRRIREHFEGKGAVFTRKFKPVAIHSVIQLGKVTKAEAAAAENIFTIELILKYSQNRVRGGGYAAEYRKVRSSSTWSRLLLEWKRRALAWAEYQEYGGYHPTLIGNLDIH